VVAVVAPPPEQGAGPLCGFCCCLLCWHDTQKEISIAMMYMDREHILLLKGKTTKWFPTTITLMSSLTKISLGFIFLFLLGRANGMDLCCHSGGAVCCSAFWHRQSWLFICTHYSDVVPVHWWHWNLHLNQIRHRCSESFLSKIHRRLLQNEWKGCMDLPWGHPFMLYR